MRRWFVTRDRCDGSPYGADAVRGARTMPPGLGVDTDWRTRLRVLVHQPGREEVLAFLRGEVLPALRDVAGELCRQGLPAETAEGEDGRVWLQVGHGEEMDFFYSVRPRAYAPPSFLLADPRRRAAGGLSCRAEVHLREGGQDYDIMGWRREDVIHDVLDQYRRHMHFLDAVR